ncbi:MAG: hypothetical protein J0H32_11265, partial [Rhizobiales bacterium]|nr:hypothetical protein [Hyphomicrobiales bacterium]
FPAGADESRHSSDHRRGIRPARGAADELVRANAARSGMTWHFARPPVIDLEFEVDCRRVMRETVI